MFACWLHPSSSFPPASIVVVIVWSGLILFSHFKARSVCANGGEQLGGLFGGNGRLDAVGLDCVIVALRTSLVEKAEY